MAANVANMRTGGKQVSYKVMNLLGATNTNVEGQTNQLSINDNTASVFDTSHLYMNSPAFHISNKIAAEEEKEEENLNDRQYEASERGEIIHGREALAEGASEVEQNNDE